ncbi:MAG TPA: beta-galactosidase [Armatimonadota bacterium]|nr:beta-galactosidase [Armatimonadota bacterium]
MRISHLIVLGIALLIITTSTFAGSSEQLAHRYYTSTVYSWWPIYKDIALFQKFVDESKQKGMNSICIDIPWTIQKDNGNYDFTESDKRIDYIVARNMTVFLRANTTTLGGQIPKWLTDEMLQQTPDGKIYRRETDGGTLPSLAHPTVRAKIIEFCEQIAAHYGKRYKSKTAGEYPVIAIIPAFNLYMDTEYFREADVDYSPSAQADFSIWAKSHYRTLANLNDLWGKEYKSWNEVSLKDAHDTAKYLYFEFTLQRILDKIGDSVRRAGSIPVGLSSGSIADNPHRRTMNITALMQKLDWLLVTDEPEDNHAFSADYARCSVPGKKIASGIDAATHAAATNGRYFNQGVRAFEHGANAVHVVNWDLASLSDNKKWPFLHFIGKLTRYPKANPKPTKAIYVSTWDLINRAASLGQYTSAYESLSEGGKKPVDILPDYVIASNPDCLAQYSEIYLPANWTIPTAVRKVLLKSEDKLKVSKPLVAGTLDEYGRPAEPLIKH